MAEWGINTRTKLHSRSGWWSAAEDSRQVGRDLWLCRPDAHDHSFPAVRAHAKRASQLVPSCIQCILLHLFKLLHFKRTAAILGLWFTYIVIKIAVDNILLNIAQHRPLTSCTLSPCDSHENISNSLKGSSLNRPKQIKSLQFLYFICRAAHFSQKETGKSMPFFQNKNTEKPDLGVWSIFLQKLLVSTPIWWK